MMADISTLYTWPFHIGHLIGLSQILSSTLEKKETETQKDMQESPDLVSSKIRTLNPIIFSISCSEASLNYFVLVHTSHRGPFGASSSFCL